MSIEPWIYDSKTGLIPALTYCASPNTDERPLGIEINLGVIHGISLPPGDYGQGYVKKLFLNQLSPADHPYFETIAHLKVSAHFFIERDGQVIQFVPVTQRAWHAGVSSWQGRERCNDYSIGIELEGTDDDAYTDHQYQSLNALCLCLQRAFPVLTTERWVGHSDIAPGRKTDPGPVFNWSRLQRALTMFTENKR